MKNHGKKVSVRRKKKDAELDKTFPPVEATDESLQKVQPLDDNDGVGPSGIAWHNEKRRVRDLKEWERNPRRLSESQAKHLAASLVKFGYVDPIQINADNRIIGGHQRARILLQAQLISGDTMIDVRVPSRQLDEKEFEELALRLNKNTGDWDWEMLSTEFDQNFLRDVGFSPMDFGMVGLKTPDFEPPKPTPSAMHDTKLRPAKPRTCPHCEEPCHCVVEE
jgi:hypothetical protein